MVGFATVYKSGKHRFICVGTVAGPRSKYILPNDKYLNGKFYSAKSSVLDKNYLKNISFSVKEELILAGNSFFSLYSTMVTAIINH